MRRRKLIDRVLLVTAAVVFGWLVVLMVEPACSIHAQEPSKPALTDTEELRLVNTYQAAVLAQVDFQTAQQRLARSRDNFTAMTDKLKAEHKWPAATTFEINGETGRVLVHLPPTVTQPSPADTKEKH